MHTKLGSLYDEKFALPGGTMVNSPFRPALGLGALRQAAQSKLQQVPTLPQVIPYLELSYKQEYLVQRIRGTCTCIVYVP